MNNEQQAFPRPGTLQDHPKDGMSLRDYFAAKAMESFLPYAELATFPDKCAERAYELADAMMKEREK